MTSMISYQNDWTVFFTRPISGTVMVFVVDRARVSAPAPRSTGTAAAAIPRAGQCLDRKRSSPGVIGSDTHIVGNRILSMALEKAGYKVVALGALTPAPDFIKAAVETNADAILVSSLYGQGELDCRGFRDLCIEAGLDDDPALRRRQPRRRQARRGPRSRSASSTWVSTAPRRPARGSRP